MLEASLRKLVREEAATAAVQAITAVGADLAAAVREGTSEAVHSATATIDRSRRLTWTPMIIPAELLAARQATVTAVNATQILTACRTKALELSIASKIETDTSDTIVARAALFAAFILDGTPHLTGRSS